MGSGSRRLGFNCGAFEPFVVMSVASYRVFGVPYGIFPVLRLCFVSLAALCDHGVRAMVATPPVPSSTGSYFGVVTLSILDSSWYFYYLLLFLALLLPSIGPRLRLHLLPFTTVGGPGTFRGLTTEFTCSVLGGF